MEFWRDFKLIWHKLNPISFESAFWTFVWNTALWWILIKVKWDEFGEMTTNDTTRAGFNYIDRYSAVSDGKDKKEKCWISKSIMNRHLIMSYRVIRCISRIIHTVFLCFNLILVWYWSILAISFWVGSLTWRRSYDLKVPLKHHPLRKSKTNRKILRPICLLDRWLSYHMISMQSKNPWTVVTVAIKSWFLMAPSGHSDNAFCHDTSPPMGSII